MADFSKFIESLPPFSVLGHDADKIFAFFEAEIRNSLELLHPLDDVQKAHEFFCDTNIDQLPEPWKTIVMHFQTLPVENFRVPPTWTTAARPTPGWATAVLESANYKI